ncbi:MAG: AraC family transcriptional regulator [Candidatus Didemnitutus sp.]|nr:AraC family transcriptional regulator [Candidatus Didemnitutus sp.]
MNFPPSAGTRPERPALNVAKATSRGTPAVPTSPLALEVRPGLVLGWGESTGRAPAADVVRLVYELQPGRMRLERFPPAPETTADAISRGFHAFIAITPATLDELLSGDGSAGAAQLRACAAERAVSFAHPLTPRARLALDSIRCCPFAGVCRVMALTARCHDLLVEFLTAWSATLQPRPTATVGPDDRVRLAAEILVRDLGAPPSLGELAAQVGLSETTLKRSFPQVHGTTVFGYVRARRMDEARRLLASGAATVLEAATLVGYSNPSNFAAAFRRQFGINPKTFQLRARGTR